MSRRSEVNCRRYWTASGDESSSDASSNGYACCANSEIQHFHTPFVDTCLSHTCDFVCFLECEIGGLTYCWAGDCVAPKKPFEFS